MATRKTSSTQVLKQQQPMPRSKGNRPAVTPAELADMQALLRLQREELKALLLRHQLARQALVNGAATRSKLPYNLVAAAFGQGASSPGKRCALTAGQLAEVRACPATVSHTTLAAQYGVSVATISRVRRGLTRGVAL